MERYRIKIVHDENYHFNMFAVQVRTWWRVWINVKEFTNQKEAEDLLNILNL